MKKLLILTILFLAITTVASAEINIRGYISKSGDVVTVDSSADLNVDGDLTVDGTMWSAPAGYIQGLTVSYVSTTSVFYGVTTVHCKDKVFITATGETDTISNFSNGGYTYGYIDYSASTPTNIVYIDSTTVPVWSDAYKGYYNGDDRCISAFYCNAADTINRFVYSNEYCLLVDNRLTCASSMNPDGTWQTPDDDSGDSYMPVNAISASIYLGGSDPGAQVQAFCTNLEASTDLSQWYLGYKVGFQGYNGVGSGTYIELGPSRKLVVLGEDNDDNGLSMHVVGYKILR